MTSYLYSHFFKRQFFMLLLSFSVVSLSYAEKPYCESVLANSTESQTFEPPKHWMRWAEKAFDTVVLFGAKDWAVSTLYSFGVKPKFAYRGLGTIFVLRPNELNLDGQGLRAKAERLSNLVDQLKSSAISKNEVTLIKFLLQQLKYVAHHHNFNIFSKQSLGWSQNSYEPLMHIERNGDWASAVIDGLQSLKFILRIQLPKDKSLYRDDDGPGSSDFGVMTVFESGELKPDQMAALVYRVNYKEKWYWADGPIKKIWLPLLLINQKSVDYLIKAPDQISGEELIQGIRKIYSEITVEKL